MHGISIENSVTAILLKSKVDTVFFFALRKSGDRGEGGVQNVYYCEPIV